MDRVLEVRPKAADIVEVDRDEKLCGFMSRAVIARSEADSFSGTNASHTRDIAHGAFESVQQMIAFVIWKIVVRTKENEMRDHPRRFGRGRFRNRARGSLCWPPGRQSRPR